MPCLPETLLALLACLVTAAPRLGHAQGHVADDHAVTLIGIDHPGGHSNPRAQGLQAWLYETRRRTSIEIDLAPKRLDLTAHNNALSAPIPLSPLFVWQGDQAFAPLPDQALAPLAQALRAGGALLVDVSDGVADGPFEGSVTRELHRLLPNVPLVPIPQDHVLYTSFYLVDRHTGRTGARPHLLGMTVEGRLAVVLSANDLSGAMARDALGGWAFAVADGDRAREMATRLSINWIMYSLCLDYKSDQVHLPFILKRRR